MAGNEQDVIDQMRAHGLMPDALMVGRIVRCKTEDDRGASKSGWYSLTEIVSRNGDLLLVGAFGNWREGVDARGKAIVHRIELRGQKLNDEERAAVAERLRGERRRAEAARQAKALHARRRAQAIWSRLPERGGPCPYLDRKGIAAHGARVSEAGNLVIPVLDELGILHGLQVVYSDPEVKKRKGRDKDFWPSGMATRGKFYLIGSPIGGCLIAEGFATAASLHEATGWPVAVAWFAGNLLPVTQALRKRYPAANLLLCADDDFATSGNPGISAASIAAAAVDRCAWVAPRFTDRGTRKLTDFNDLHSAEGLHVVRAQLEERLKALGWTATGGSVRAGTAGGVGDPSAFHFDLDVMRDNYALIYGTDTVFDRMRRRIVQLGPLRAAAGSGLVSTWLDMAGRRTVLPEEVVFDPSADPDDEGICNLWGGWPSTPQSGSCERLLELLEFLCNNERNGRALSSWVLRWLAYPIQHPGAKMATALLVHGPEGTGKNTFFGAIRRIYGRYGCSFSQVELESQFNGWASGRLFAIGNEVVTRAELYHQQGRLKNMITEPEWVINEKMMPARLEANHCNFVFNSNRVDIAKLDQEDRRYCVIWTPPALDRAFYSEVAAEISEGGIPALHHHLLHLDLGDMHEHAKPPMTQAKADLIELSLDNPERFWVEWVGGHLPVPHAVCRSQDLYDAYTLWARRVGIVKPVQMATLMAWVGKKAGVRKERARYQNGHGVQQSMVVYPGDPMDLPGSGTERLHALGERVAAFGSALEDWRQGLSS